MKTLKVTEKCCAQALTRELRVLLISAKEGKIITESPDYGQYGQRTFYFSDNEFKELTTTNWLVRRLVGGSITYNLV